MKAWFAAEGYNISMFRVTATNLLLLAFLAACDSARDRETGSAPAAGAPTPQSTMFNPDQVVRSEEEWRQRLTPEQYRVLRQKGTERAFTGEFTDQVDPGTYHCAACDAELFRSEHKFHSGCGWPSFYTALAGNRVTLVPDHSHGMIRTEVLCARCGSHLGHVFDDAPDQPTGQRYCINSISLKFVSTTPATRPSGH